MNGAANAPILVLDSGVGGFSVLKEIQVALPHAPIVYCADNAGFPYGTKSEAEIAARVPILLGRLAERFKPCVAVIACNTASTIALDAVRAALAIPVVGTVPAVKPAALASKTRVIGILGTEATVRQAYVDDLVARFASDCLVLRHGSAALVEMAEAKLRGSPPSNLAVAEELNGLLKQDSADRIDQLVLSCTHFPLLADEIDQACPSGISLVDSGAGIARRTAFLTKDCACNGQSHSNVMVFTRQDDAIEALKPALDALNLTRIAIL